MEGGLGGGGGGGTYDSGECHACRAERRTGVPSRTFLLLPPRVILLFIFPIHSNHDEKIPKWGETNDKTRKKTANENQVE